MKRLNRRLLLLAVLVFCLSPMQALAEALWSETYYRASDYTDQLSDQEREELDSLCLEFMGRAKADLSVVAVSDETLADTNLSLEAFAEYFYQECGFGYGGEHTGFQMVWNTDTDEVLICPFGGAEAVVPQRYLDFVAGSVAKYRVDYGVFGPLYSTVKFLSDYLDREPEAEQPSGEVEAPSEEPAPSQPSSARVGTDGDKPAWYPVDPEHFPKYHDPDAPRVVDVADLIPDEEEPALEARLAEIREELGKDMVIFTDVSSYGLDRSVYAADFYDFNGYGIGEDYEGVCMFVCMEPGNRGFWTCCTGPETMAIYTEDVANQIDDITYEYMKNGDYAEGLRDWAENFRLIYLTGSPFTPDWAAGYDPSAPRLHNPEAPRVVDEGKLLTSDEAAALEARAWELSRQYGADVVICTARSSGSMTAQEYADTFFAAGGYGQGEDGDGILLTVFRRPGSYDANTLVTLYGSVKSRVREAGRARLERRCDFLMDMQEYGKACTHWLEQTDFTLRTGLAPRGVVSWAIKIGVFSLIGGVAAYLMLQRAKNNMGTPAIQEQAGRYLDYGSIQISSIEDELLNTTESERYDPIRTRSSGGSSGRHRSTYSRSYKGSSGTTHSGSGRSF